jgi:hypothetical protein
MFKIRRVNQPLVLADLIYLLSENNNHAFFCSKIDLINYIIKDLYLNSLGYMYVIYTEDDKDLVGYVAAKAEINLTKELFVLDAYITEKYRKNKDKPLQLAIDECMVVANGLNLTFKFITRKLSKEFWEQNYNFGGQLKLDPMYYVEVEE